MGEIGFKTVAFPAGGAVFLSVAALFTGVGRAAPSSFELVVNGFHRAAGPPEKFALGFRHEGPFTASVPFCASGYMVEVEAPLPGLGLRQFTCNDGSGSVTTRKSIVRADPQFTHEEGVWAIVEGAGRYASLRGKGTYVTDHVSGDPGDHIATAYREVWRGVIDFDATPPVVRISAASAKPLARPKGTYSVRVVFTAEDGNDGNAVSYAMTMSGPGVFVRRTGTASGTVATTFRVRPRKRVRRLQVLVVASDPVGNETRVGRQLKLPAPRD